LGRAVDRTALCAKLFEGLDNWYAKLRRGHPEALLARWRTLSCLLGHGVCARLAGGEVRETQVRGTQVWGTEVRGTVVGLRATGELILRTESGEDLLLTSERATLLLGRPGA
jgi:biotin-(acetyl-CoA carboxylase) ligase